MYGSGLVYHSGGVPSQSPKRTSLMSRIAKVFGQVKAAELAILRRRRRKGVGPKFRVEGPGFFESKL